jgi:hypothetical protein
MLLVAVGNDAEKNGLEGKDWEINTASLALSTGIVSAKELALDFNRDTAVLYAFNGLNYTTAGTKTGKFVLNDLDGEHSVAALDGEVFDSRTEAILAAQSVNSDAVYGDDYTVTAQTDNSGSLGATVYNLSINENSSDAYGRPATEYIQTVNGVPKTIALVADEALATITDGSFNTKTTKWKNYDWSTATVILNGNARQTDISYGDGDELAVPGYTVSLYGEYNTSTKKYDVDTVVVTEYYFAQITDVTDDKDIEITLYDNDDSTTYPHTVKYTKDADEQSDEYNLLKDYAEDTYLAVIANTDFSTAAEVLAVATPKTATGTVSRTSYNATSFAGYAVLGSTSYTLANSYTHKAIAVKDEGTFYLDPNGYVLQFITTSEASTPDTLYAYVINTAEDSSDIWNGAKEMAQLYLISTGEQVTVELSDESLSSSSEAPDADPKGSIVEYEVDKDGIYTLSNPTAVSATTETQSTNLVITKGVANGTINGTATVFNSKTVFVVISTVNGKPVYTTYTGIANVPSIVGKDGSYAGAVTDNGIATVVVVSSVNNAASASTETYYIIDNSSEAIDDVDLGEYYEYAAIVNGTITTVKVEKNAKISGDQLVSSVSVDSNGVITALGSNVTGKADATATTALKNDILGLGSNSYTVSSDCAVYVIEDGVATKSSVSAIKTDSNDKVVYTLKDGVVTSLYITKVAPAS